MNASAGTTDAFPAFLTERDVAALLFIADMYAVQLDQLAAILGVTEARARAITLAWRRARYAESARIGPGRPWIWLTRAGLAACGLPYRPASPALSRLAHLRAVISVRLAFEAAPGYARAGAFWRGERRLRAAAGGRVGLREHIPDGEVHWPDGAPVSFAGECWAIEAELTRKTVARTAAIMHEILARTGDYGCPAGQAQVAPDHRARSPVAPAGPVMSAPGGRLRISTRRPVSPSAALARATVGTAAGEHRYTTRA